MKVRAKPMNYFLSWREISNLTKIDWKNYKKHSEITKLKPNDWKVKWKGFSILTLDGDKAIFAILRTYIHVLYLCSKSTE